MARALNVLAGDRQVGQLREQDDIWEFEYTAHQLIAEIESETETEVAQCPNPGAASEFVPSEMRLLSCIRGIVIQDMLRQVATA